MPYHFNAFPVLHTARLSLIEISDAHRIGLFNLFTDPKVTEYYHVIPIKEEQDLQKVIGLFRSRYHEKTGIRWGIALKGTENIIGTIGYNSFTQGHRASIVYALMPGYWGNGYITEAMHEVIRFGFKELGINRVEAEVMPGNVLSEKVLEKLGFTYEGLLRQWALWQGKYYDMKMYSLLAS
jgi:ribosomal-protein-alanine N-acetyltransferase